VVRVGIVMIKISLKNDVEYCPHCGCLAVKVYLIQVGSLEFILCHKCVLILRKKINRIS
jgi:hypothetical protein